MNFLVCNLIIYIEKEIDRIFNKTSNMNEFNFLKFFKNKKTYCIYIDSIFTQFSWSVGFYFILYCFN